jgi:hypothetical protein
MHLRNLNPYVSAALSEWNKRHMVASHLPLGQAPLPIKGFKSAAGEMQSTPLFHLRVHKSVGKILSPDVVCPGLSSNPQSIHRALACISLVTCWCQPRGRTALRVHKFVAQPSFKRQPTFSSCLHHVPIGTQCKAMTKFTGLIVICSVGRPARRTILPC